MPRRLAPQPWMATSEMARLLDALTARGAEVRFVGGCVRDALAGRPVNEVDLATDAEPQDVMDLLQAAGIKAVPTGIEHGTVTAVVEGKAFEVTSLRVDIETDGRHAKVIFGTDWKEDAARRDLTFNAMSMRPDGTLFDPFGGEADLAQGCVRFVGEARRRIEEDVLRLLRWFRFYAFYGQPPPDREALEACRALAYRLDSLSRERVRHEVLRLLQAPEPMPALTLMQETGVLHRVVGVGTTLDRLARLRRVETMAALTPDNILRLAALAPWNATTVDTLAERLRLSNAERGRLAAMTAFGPVPRPTIGSAQRREAIYRLGRDVARDRLLLAWADDPDGAGWNDALRQIDAWKNISFPLSGRDALALGVPHGQRIGALLDAVEAWWIDENFTPDRAACLERLRVLAGNDGT